MGCLFGSWLFALTISEDEDERKAGWSIVIILSVIVCVAILLIIEWSK
jgi:hypothetical protein